MLTLLIHHTRAPQFLEAAADLANDDAQQPPCLHANLIFPGPLGNIVVEIQVCDVDVVIVLSVT